MAPSGACSRPCTAALNLGLVLRTAGLGPARRVQVGIGIVLPFLFQWAMGGIVASGGGMLWAMLAMVGALTFDDLRRGTWWLVAFVVFTVISGVNEIGGAQQAGHLKLVRVGIHCNDSTGLRQHGSLDDAESDSAQSEDSDG